MIAGTRICGAGHLTLLPAARSSPNHSLPTRFSRNIFLMPNRTRLMLSAKMDPLLIHLLENDDRFDVRNHPCETAEELVGNIRDAEILVSRYETRVSRRVIEAGADLRLVVQGTSGLDNIDHAAAAERGVAIVGLPGLNANAVAELVISHMISLTRTVGFYDGMVRRKEWSRSDCMSRRELRAHRIGIVGLGNVGGSVARLAGHFGAISSAYDPYITEAQARQRGARLVPTLGEILETSDILTLHIPLTDETRGMIGAAELDRLPERAFVINTSRGPVVDVNAILDRLCRSRLAGAALDVFDPEPPEEINWPAVPNLILTPHIAGCTREAKESVARKVFDVVSEWVARRRASNDQSSEIRNQ